MCFVNTNHNAVTSAQNMNRNGYAQMSADASLSKNVNQPLNFSPLEQHQTTAFNAMAMALNKAFDLIGSLLSRILPASTNQNNSQPVASKDISAAQTAQVDSSEGFLDKIKDVISLGTDLFSTFSGGGLIKGAWGGIKKIFGF